MNNRFIILADVHLGLEGPQPDGKTYGNVSSILDRAVEQALALNPRHVILLGDLVNRGYALEYRQALKKLTPIRQRCIPILGNHELQRAAIADFESQMNVRAFRTETICGLRSIILNSGLENLPDSQWHGALSDEQLRFVDEALIRKDSRPLLVFVHHPIAGTVRDSEKPMHALTNSDELASRLRRHAGPGIVFSAHTHSQSFATDGLASYIGAPALGFWPHAMLVVDVDENALRFSTLRLLERPEGSPDPGAAFADYRAAREGGARDCAGNIPLAGA